MSVPKVAKWPFFVGDTLLLAAAAWLVFEGKAQWDLWHAGVVVFCVVLAALFGVIPFLTEYRGTLRFAEATELTTTVAQLDNLRAIQQQIASATGQWQGVQEQCAKTVATSSELVQRISAEALAFQEFLTKASDRERTLLKLEVEKARRGEGEWLQVLVRILDHVYALTEAGRRSGQPGLIEQLDSFQKACQDAARRIGLVPIVPPRDELFSEGRYQLPDKIKARAGDRVAETLAMGYTFQGQFLRQPLITLKRMDAPIESDPKLIAVPQINSDLKAVG